jgi:hypothetical protein
LLRPAVRPATFRLAAVTLVLAITSACGISPGGNGSAGDDVASVALSDAKILKDPKT